MDERPQIANEFGGEASIGSPGNGTKRDSEAPVPQTGGAKRGRDEVAVPDAVEGSRMPSTGRASAKIHGRRAPSRWVRTVGVAALLCSLVAAPASAIELDKYDWRIADVLVARPLGLGYLAAGAAFFIVAAVGTYPFGNDDAFEDAYSICILSPYDHVARRPLGEF